jgi:L-amino acid N-acyltransferase YncA
MLFTLFPFRIEGYEEIYSLWRQCEGVGLSSADSWENINSFLERNPGMSFVASAEGRIIGTVLAGQDGRRGYIYHLAVHPEWRHQGLGRTLVGRCLKALKEAGIQKCHLFVFNDNSSGLTFWKSVGWEQRVDLVVMSKTLEGSTGEAFFPKVSANAPDLFRRRSDPLFSIRKMTKQDWPAVRSIYQEGMAGGNATFETQAPSWTAWDAVHLKECRLVATDGERVVGWTALSLVSGRCVYAGVAEVSVYIATEERGRGIGKLLLQGLIQESEKNGIWTLQAGIFPENETSISLHQKCGFRMIGRRERLGQMNGWWRDVLLFERRSPVIGISEPR